MIMLTYTAVSGATHSLTGVAGPLIGLVGALCILGGVWFTTRNDRW